MSIYDILYVLSLIFLLLDHKIQLRESSLKRVYSKDFFKKKCFAVKKKFLWYFKIALDRRTSRSKKHFLTYFKILGTIFVHNICVFLLLNFKVFLSVNQVLSEM